MDGNLLCCCSHSDFDVSIDGSFTWEIVDSYCVFSSQITRWLVTNTEIRFRVWSTSFYVFGNRSSVSVDIFIVNVRSFFLQNVKIKIVLNALPTETDFKGLCFAFRFCSREEVNFISRNLNNSNLNFFIDFCQIDRLWVPIVSCSDHNIGCCGNTRQMLYFNFVVTIDKVLAVCVINFWSKVIIHIWY